MASLNPTKLIALAFGDPSLYEKLFEHVKNQFKISQVYKNTQNKIEFESTLDLKLLKIATKYYDINLNLQFIPATIEESISLKEFLKPDEELEAIFILLSNENKSFLKTKLFESLLEINKNTLNILISNDKQAEGPENFIEIKFDPNDAIQTQIISKDDNEEEEDEEEYSELDELINTMFVHSWSNMTIKSSSSKDHPALNEQKNANEEDINDDIDFENLIINLKEIRSKASELDFEERKKYAENVVLNFWKTLGGDAEEIAGLDGDDSDLD